MALRFSAQPSNAQELIEELSTKVGIVLLVLGGMHFFNLFVFHKIRRRAHLKQAPPPVAPNATVSVVGGPV